MTNKHNLFISIQLGILLVIALMLMITKGNTARIFIDINILLVSIYLLTSLRKNTTASYLSYFGLLFIMITTTNLHLILSKQKALFIYLNVSIVLYYFVKEYSFRDKSTNIKLFFLMFIPLSFTLLHWLAIGTFELKNNALNIWYSTFITISIWLLAKQNKAFITQHAGFWIMTTIVLYTLSQLIGFIYQLNLFGTTKNPHYLALYSALAFALSFYYIFNAQKFIRVLLVASAIILGFFILISSSRPVWIALILSSLFLYRFTNKRKRLIALGVMITSQILLFTTNLQNYRTRFTDLAANITHEERVFIWQNAWDLQRLSSFKEWIIGHGIDRFRPLFMEHSTYNSSTGFHSPHNLFLDVVFTFGITGMLLVIFLYYLLYKECYLLKKRNALMSPVVCLLLILMTTNLLFNAINMPFFSKFNIFQIAFIAGAILFFSENKASNDNYSNKTILLKI